MFDKVWDKVNFYKSKNLPSHLKPSITGNKYRDLQYARDLYKNMELDDKAHGFQFSIPEVKSLLSFNGFILPTTSNNKLANIPPMGFFPSSYSPSNPFKSLWLDLNKLSYDYSILPEEPQDFDTQFANAWMLRMTKAHVKVDDTQTWKQTGAAHMTYLCFGYIWPNSQQEEVGEINDNEWSALTIKLQWQWTRREFPLISNIMFHPWSSTWHSWKENKL